MIPKSNLYLLLVCSLVLVVLTIWSVNTNTNQSFYLFDMLYGQNIKYVEQLQQKNSESSSWQPTLNFHQKKGNYTLRGEVKLTKNNSQIPEGILIVMQASYDLYWDGQLIGKNGVVGTGEASEIPGKMSHVFLIPPNLAHQGKHQILLKLSNYYRPSPVGFKLLFVANYDQLIQQPLIFTAGIYILAGSFITIAIYYLLLYLIAYRQISVLIFGILSLLFCALTLFEHSKHIYQYLYPWHQTRLLVVAILSYVICYLIVLFFLTRFRTPHKIPILIVLTILLVCMDELNLNPEDVFYMYITALFVALLVIIRAVSQRQKGSMEAFSGILTCFLSLSYYDLTLFLGFFGLAIFMLVSLSIQFKEQQTIEKEALLRSGRLEIELLKKQLQPHFLMNTLTSIIGWIEAEPQTSVKLIEALAKELDILLEIAPKKLIPLYQEIDLCHSHIEVMKYRKSINYTFETAIIDQEVLIPPAIFHTLLENGITHSEVGEGDISFLLKQQKIKEVTLYSFESRMKSEHQIPLKNESSSGGTGHRYVKARLEESFSGKWKFYSENHPNGWKDIIEIK